MKLTEYLPYFVLLTSPGALALVASRAPGSLSQPQYSLDGKGTTADVPKARASADVLCSQYINNRLDLLADICNIVESEGRTSIALCSSDDTKAPLGCENVEKIVDIGEYETQGRFLEKKMCIIFFRGGMMYILCSPSISGDL
ncbi:uncharacterized protein H6S33_005337 [Morchella sextelata]|uniref:uncharacterized protein n=1 Tax=Morchella sextelata TaxID=1174677 RepID=UPI001D03EB1E|nr:uncharacterized protein H6S33_005337 [Morchella sextelata]KAH0613451.1 hypothetical protein H6S33_005337 [Morchella sextelata]